MPQGKNRYPGIRSFEADDQILFNGRSKEISELFNLIKIKPLVVLFGKSGLGKTSLLKAGVGPLLLKQHYFPIMIRLQDTGISPSTSVLNALENYVDQDLLNKYGNKTKNKIWEYLNAAFFKETDGSTATPVLIFDQFEELFNHPKEVQEEFTSQIGDLIENRMPADIENALNQVPRSERTKELMTWFNPPNLKIVFAIRSDRMSELHKMRFEIPAILQNRYELKPLQAQQAKDAIEKPAALDGNEFLTSPFTFATESIEKIQSELSNEFGEIESFQLQIICQYIERNVKKAQNEGKQNVEVTTDYLGGDEGIPGILKNYYNTQISLLGTNEEQNAARLLIEESLIVNKRRISVAEAVVKESHNINDDLLGKLLTSRLIRPEDTRLGRTFEISHDTLVKPILDAFQKRKAGEKRIEEIRERLLNQKKRKRARIAAVINFLIAIVCAVGLIFVYRWYEEAVEAKGHLEEAILDADEARDEAEKAKAELADYVNKQSVAAEAALEAAETVLDAAITDSGTTSTEKQAYKEQRRNLEKTKTELKTTLSDSENKGKVQLEKINLKRSETLIQDLYSSDENTRTKATKTILSNYRNDPVVIASILEASKGNVTIENQNSVFQIIYILERSSKGALKKNEHSIAYFIKEVKKVGLAGQKTKPRLKNIEKKLKE